MHFRGLGLETPNGIAVGWYPDFRQLAFIDYFFAQDPDYLLASWALGGFSSLGTEALARK